MCCVWAAGACAAAAGTAAAARMDPAALSARIAGMMMARPMRMTPPWRSQRSARLLRGQPSPHAASALRHLFAGLMPIQALGYANSKDFLDANICAIICIDSIAAIVVFSCRKSFSTVYLKNALQLSSHSALTTLAMCTALGIELISEKRPLVDQISG